MLLQSLSSSYKSLFECPKLSGEEEGNGLAKKLPTFSLLLHIKLKFVVYWMTFMQNRSWHNRPRCLFQCGALLSASFSIIQHTHDVCVLGGVIKKRELFMKRLHCGQPAVFPAVHIEMPLAKIVRLALRRRGVYAIWHWDNIYSRAVLAIMPAGPRFTLILAEQCWP